MERIFLIGNAHIDPVWLWKRAEGLSEIKATFRSALDRMNEFPGYIFTSACASYYKWIEESEPEMFDEIRKRIKEGRWAIAGGMWVQPDCNIPCGESFARHLLYSQNYFLEKFGVLTDTGYNVDSFGHNGMLPQLLAKAGISSYVFMRPDSDKEKPSLPENLFVWRAPDGSETLTYRIPLPYCTAGVPRLDEYKALSERDGVPYMAFYGVGNHGGGPTVSMLSSLEKLIGKDIKYSSPSEYFRSVRENIDMGKLRVLKDEDLQHHASGCYAALAKVKKLNRRAETALISAEKSQELCRHLLPGTKSRRDKLSAAWEKVMFNQFHDILAGCAIKDACDEAYNAFGYAMECAQDINDFMLWQISWNRDTGRYLSEGAAVKSGVTLWEKEGEGAPAVIFNINPFPVETAVTINVGDISGICDENGNPLPLQRVRGPQNNGTDHFNTLFIASLPAYGYRTYYLYRGNSFDTVCGGALKAGDGVIENQYLRVEFDTVRGYIRSFTDKEKGETTECRLAAASVFEDRDYDTWAHGAFTFDKKAGDFSDPDAGSGVRAEISVVEAGPLKAALKVVTRYGSSYLTQYFTMYPYSRDIEVKAELFLYDKLKRVRLSFESGVSSGDAIYAMPFGYIKKETNGEEEPAQLWADIGDERRGITVISDSKYSFSAEGGTLYMTIARSCMYADHFGKKDIDAHYQDLGEQCFEYVIRPRGEFDPAVTAKRTAQLLYKPYTVLETHHGGALSTSFSALSEVLPDNIMVEAVKECEEGGGTAVRIYESAGRSCSFKFTMFGKERRLSFTPFEIKTVIFPENGESYETGILEREDF